MPEHAPRQRAAARVAAWISLVACILFAGDLTRSVVDAAPSINPDPGERGSAEGLARSLGLGTRRMAAKLLRKRPPLELRAAVRGRGSERLTWPVERGVFGRGFGFVRKTRKNVPHLGIDIGARSGTPIRAAADGLVAYADDGLRGYGNYLMLVHRDGDVTSYAHCSRMLAVPGQRVTRGEVIALVGSTGISKGPHLHFELRIDGKATNPMTRFERGKDQALHARLATLQLDPTAASLP